MWLKRLKINILPISEFYAPANRPTYGTSWCRLSWQTEREVVFDLRGISPSDIGYCLTQYLRKFGETFSWNDSEKKEFPMPTVKQTINLS